MHYVFDLWAQRWRRTQARGDVVTVRFLDDFIVGFQDRADAERFLTALRERLGQFGLTLHPDKTRLLEFWAVRRRTTPTARAEEAGDISVPRVRSQLWADSSWKVCGASTDGRTTPAGQAQRGQE